MKRSRQQKAEHELDIHDEPTEPSIPAVILPPSSPSLDWNATPANGAMFPVAQSPQSTLSNAPIAQTPMPSPWLMPVYPMLPTTATPSVSTPNQQNMGGQRLPYPVRPPNNSSRNIQRKHNILPDLVGMFFVAVQILLLVRFALRLITPTITSGTPWIGIIYTASGIFVLPFRLLFQHIAFPVPGSLEIYSLVAILCYGLLSRVLARFTKALLRSL